MLVGYMRVSTDGGDRQVLDLQRDASITKAQQVAAHFLFAQLIRRAPVVRGQTANCVDVNRLSSSGEPRQGHVLGHPQAQRCH